MKKACLISLFVLVLSPVALAKGGPMARGGLGLVFPDTNSFNNASRFAMMNGFAVEGMWRHFKESSEGLARPSVVFGNGKLGFGVYGQRVGNLKTPARSSDSVGVGGGVALVEEKLLFGAAYERSIESTRTDNGTLTGTLSLIPKGKGFYAVASGSTTFHAVPQVRTAAVGVGYGLSPVVMVEAAGRFNNLSDLQDITGTAGLVLQGKVVYAAGLYTFQKPAKTHGAEGRLGFVIANFFDASGYVQKTFAQGEEINFGATGRFRL